MNIWRKRVINMTNERAKGIVIGIMGVAAFLFLMGMLVKAEEWWSLLIIPGIAFLFWIWPKN